MNTPITNRYDFVYIFDVKDGNPNGDPDAGNLPRLDPETGCGLVTDVCLKRKVRNYVQLTKQFKTPFDIYVQEKAVLGRAHTTAFKELGISCGQEARKEIPESLTTAFDESELPEGLSVEDAENSDASMLVVACDADKKEIDMWLKDKKSNKDLVAFIKAVMKEAKPRKPTKEETERGREYMCQNYYDIRTFGAVMSLKTAPNCGQVRGPVQLTFARSVDPIVTLEHSITRMAVATEAEAEKQRGDNRTMGRKNTVPYGLYVAHGFISAHLAAQTGFSQDDLELLWNALGSMFEHDRSAARGEMTTRKLVIFQHASALGNAHAHALFERVHIVRKPEVAVPRAFSDYSVSVDETNLPDGIHVICRP